MKEKAIARTKKGLLEGVRIDGVYRFLGVHYAQDTSGKNRFMPPKPVEPWEGVKPALEHVAKCWQTDAPRMEDKEVTGTKYFINQQKLMVGSSEMGVGRMTEDCCAVNIWTNGLADGKKRPVMVWFHGGGTIAGAAEADWHDGYNLAKKQDVVLVNVGHRLGIFGYLYLGGLGDERFEHSANLGHQDMVAALKWVQENIEAFGGDPDNVTIFGQSGGGTKVASLLGMPMAKGLFHKAIIQSGGYRVDKLEDGMEQTRQLLDYLKLGADRLDELQKIPAAELIRIQREINAARPDGAYFNPPLIFDGEVMVKDSFDGGEGTMLQKDIPLIVGFCKDDRALRGVMDPKIFEYSFEDLVKAVMALGYDRERSLAIIEAYKKILPPEEATNAYIYFCVNNDVGQHGNVLKRYAARKAVGAAPTYSYVFSFESPDPDLKAIHGVDVPFFFDAAIYAPGLWNVDTRVGAMKLSEDAAAAWAAFARTGNPSNPAMPVWKPYEEEHRYMMRLDVESTLVDHYHWDAIRLEFPDVR